MAETSFHINRKRGNFNFISQCWLFSHNCQFIAHYSDFPSQHVCMFLSHWVLRLCLTILKQCQNCEILTQNCKKSLKWETAEIKDYFFIFNPMEETSVHCILLFFFCLIFLSVLACTLLDNAWTLYLSASCVIAFLGRIALLYPLSVSHFGYLYRSYHMSTFHNTQNQVQPYMFSGWISFFSTWKL